MVKRKRTVTEVMTENMSGHRWMKINPKGLEFTYPINIY